MAFMYYLPDENGKEKEYGTSTNAVIIIGANGSGKSKLGAWIEQQSMQNVHRIGAQRKLNFSENIPLTGGKLKKGSAGIMVRHSQLL